MKTPIFILLLVLMPAASFFAQAPTKIYLHQYKFSQQIQKEIASGELYPSQAAQELSYIGRYAEALQIPNEVDLDWGFDQLSVEDQTYLNTFSGADAVETLLAKAGNHQIVIINEAHHKPRHRLLTYQLMDGLYDQGFRYFGIEALSNCAEIPGVPCDTLLNERGYALNAYNSGTYVKDPKMALLIRKGIQTGFELFAYEKFGRDRDLWQARYIAKILEKDPEAKIVVHVGWYHLLEESNYGRRWMADYLQEITGVDPLTIYQDILIERYCSPESPYFSALPPFEEPTVLLNEAGKFFNGPEDFSKFDVLVYHPRTTYIRNRPDWWVHFGDNQVVELDKESIAVSYPVLIKAYDPQEVNATPLDIIELRFPDDPTALVLPPSVYRLELEDITGTKQNLTIQVKSEN